MKKLKKFIFPKFTTQGNKYASSKSNSINKMPTIKNCILNVKCPSPKGSNPHSYGEVFSNVNSLGDKITAIKNKIQHNTKLIIIKNNRYVYCWFQ
jgi:hypothetical protein